MRNLHTTITTLFLFPSLALTDRVPSNFLQEMISEIHKERIYNHRQEVSLLQRIDDGLHHDEVNATNLDSPQEHDSSSSILPISKDTIMALYKAAIKTGASINFSQLDDHNLNQAGASLNGEKLPGYHYYYFPIQNFLQEIEDHKNQMEPPHGDNKLKEKTVQPLFVAIASFVSVAMMFAASILFLPKFGALKTKDVFFKRGTEDFFTFTDLVSESLEGKDCSQRIICEVAQSIRKMKLGTHPIRIIELLVPPNIAKQLAQVRKAVGMKTKCGTIMCLNDTKDKKPKGKDKKQAL